MNILHIDEQRAWRGGEQQASYLIRGLSERGHQTYIAGRPGSAFLTRTHGCVLAGIIPAAFRGEFDPASLICLTQAIRRHEIDIAHAHTSHAHAYACLACKFARRGKAIVSRRVDFPPRKGLLNRKKYACPDHYVVISERIGDVLRDYGVPDEKLTLVHSGIDPERFNVAPLSREEIGVPRDAFLFGNVAALVGHKDQATLIAAMPAVVQAFPGVRLVIAGEGALRPRIEAQIRELGLGDAVHLLGFRQDVPQLLRALDAFVLSSREEGLGTAVLEAMACRLPVAAAPGGGIPEMVKHETTGLLAEAIEDPASLARQMIRLIEDRPLAASLASAGHDMLHERFTADRMVEGNVAVYEKVLANS